MVSVPVSEHAEAITETAGFPEVCDRNETARNRLYRAEIFTETTAETH
jgi:hypothetical protein